MLDLVQTMSIHHCNPQTQTKRPHAGGFGPGRRHAVNRGRRRGRLEHKDELGLRVRSTTTPPSRQRSGLQDRPDVPDRPSTTCAAVPSVCAASSSKPPKLIRSQNNPKVKHCVKLLQSKKYRDEQQKVMLCGRTLLEEIGPYMPDIDSVFYIGSEHVDVLDYANDPYLHVDSPFVRELLSTSTTTYNVTKQIMGKLCNVTTVGDSHVAAEVDLPAFQDFRAYAPGTLTRLLVLERCQDPGNMGTLLRSCVAFGFDGVFLLPGCADPFNDKTLRASRGAGWRVPRGSRAVKYARVCGSKRRVCERTVILRGGAQGFFLRLTGKRSKLTSNEHNF